MDANINIRIISSILFYFFFTHIAEGFIGHVGEGRKKEAVIKINKKINAISVATMAVTAAAMTNNLDQAG